jgi:amino acid adenylation domain-containing protein/FkbM family methyltransferase
MEKQKNNIQKIYLLTPMQEGMLFHSIKDNSDAYFDQLFYTITGKIDIDVFSESLDVLSKRHDILRTAFTYQKTERPIQVVLKNRKIAVKILDKTILSTRDYDCFLEEYKEEDIKKGFDLVKEPLIRISIIKREEALYDFLWSYHHILLDGWCHAILIEEIGKIYHSLKYKRAIELPTPIHFDSYVKWLAKKNLEVSKQYWKTYLDGYNHIAELPKVVNRDFLTLKNPNYIVKFNKEFSKKLAELVKKYNITQNDVFQTVWGLLLAKYSNSNDVVYGNVVSGRPPELEGVDKCLGLFINTIPVRFQYTTNQTLIALAKKNHEDFLDGMPHHYDSLAEIQNDTEIKNDLIKHVIAFENYPLSEINDDIDQLFKISNLDVFDRTNYDFDVDIELAEEIKATFYYNSNDYHPKYIKKIANTFEILIHQFVDNPAKEINELNFVSEENTIELLHHFNQKEIDLNNTEPVNVLFQNQTLLNENAISVIHNNQKWTYKQLNDKANKIAKTLLENGLEKGDFVGLHLHRCPELIAALLGIFKAGGVYVPLDTQNPVKRTLQLIKDGQINALISDCKQLDILAITESFSDNLKQILCIDGGIKKQENYLILSSKDCIEKKSTKNPENVNTITDWAYMLYTSGSTGNPKGAITRYDGAINHILAEYKALNLQDGFCFLQSASIASDISVWQILAPLLKGGSVLIADKDDVLDYQKIVQLMKQYKVTVAEFVPSYLIGFVDYILELKSEENQLPSLQWMMMVGEEIPVKLVNNWIQLFPNCKVLNGYGPCEASDDITQYEITHVLPEHTLKVPIGKPIHNMNIFVLDDNEKLIPVGVAGEICVSGIGVGAGYFKEPEKTAKSFKPNPFPNTLGSTMYKTGDLGRWLPDGNLEFLGRKDRQVKIRGNRVELGEIEAFVRENNFVENVAVVAVKKSPSDVSLIAFITKKDSELPIGFNKKFIKEREHQIEVLQNVNEDLKDKILTLENNVKMFSLNHSETSFVFKEIFTDKAYLQHGIKLKPESVVFDIGANIGMFSVMVATCFPKSSIYAFEPIPPTYKFMEANTKLYSFIANIYPYKAGLSNEKRTVTFTHYPKNSMLSGMYSNKEQDKGYIKNVIEQQLITNKEELNKGIHAEIDKLTKDALISENYECQLLTISDVIAEHDIKVIDLLKIDVERSERDVLEGIKDEDWSKVQQIVIEVHDNGTSLEEIIQLFKEKGFTSTIEQEKLLAGTDLFNIYACRDIKEEISLKTIPFNIYTGETDEKKEASLKTILFKNCAKKLPYYMQPLEYCFIDEIPQNLSDKVDEKKLIAKYNNQLTSNGLQVIENVKSCKTATEKIIKEIWEQILQKTDIGAEDDFFEKGGHSLLAMRVKSAIFKKMKVDLDIRNLFVYTKLNELAKHVDQNSISKESAKIGIQEKPERIPLSYAQESLWFIDNLQGKTTEYNISAAIKLKGNLNVQLLEASLQAIINRHETLKSVVQSNEGVPYLSFLETKNWTLNTINEAYNCLDTKIEELVSQSFNLATDFKLKAYVIQQNKNENILVLVMHHIASDGWSESILVDELIVFYEAGLSNVKANLPSLPIQYSDYILWQQKNKIKLDHQITYWKENLKDITTLELSTDYERPKIQSTNGNSLEVLISKEVLTNLKEVSIAKGVTLYMTLLAAYKVLLYKYTGQNDIAIGTPIAGRTNQELERLIGFFVNTLVIRSTVDPESNFNNFLKEVKNTALDAYKNQDAPFEKVVEAVVKQRDLSRNPLFQVMFTLQNTPDLKEIRLGDLEATFINPDFLQVQSDLHFLVEETSNGNLKLEIEYCSDIFERKSIENLATHYTQLLDEILENSSEKIKNLSLINEKEKSMLLNDFNATTLDFSIDETILDILNNQVEKSPNTIAILHNNESITYKELNVRSNQIAQYLIEKGITKETLVPICMERTILTVISIFGILKAGGVYVPIGSNNPSDRISFIIEDTKAKLLITSSDVLEKINFPSKLDLVIIDTITNELETYSSENIALKISQNNLAYIIYTSGTTGKPKGVMIEHKGLYSFVAVLQETHPLQEQDTMAFKTNFGFDMAIIEIFGWLKGGASMVIISEEIVKKPNLFIQELINKKITYLSLVPTYFSVFLDYAIANNTLLPNLRYLEVGGEALPVNTAKKYLSSNLTAKLDNMYGPSEITVYSNYHPINELAEKASTVPIGKPTANSTIYILSDNLEILPIGVVGEICIGGLGVARGYLNSPKLTSEKFIENPFVKGERIYKSGDLGKWLPDGSIVYVGRKDSQVKIRGYRIELTEIETFLDKENTIKQSVVVTTDSRANKQLVAYLITPTPTSTINTKKIQNNLLLKLPEYMVPKTYILLDEFPLDNNGKINRKKLQEKTLENYKTTNYIAATTEIEEKLTTIWKNLLHLEKVSITDNFFELGGHSILVMRTIFEIQKELNIAIDVKLLFQNPTIEELAKKLEAIDTTKGYEKIAEIEEAEFYETSQAQKRIWLAEQVEINRSVYNITMALQMKGAVVLGRLKWAINYVINKHEILRTNFIEIDGIPYQKIHSCKEGQSDFKIIEAINTLETAKIILLEEENYEFDLELDALIRFRLITNNKESFFIVNLHHIIGDGWSIQTLQEDVLKAYKQIELNNSLPIENLSIQYKDYAFWHNKQLKKENLKIEEYWLKALEGIQKRPEIPLDKAREINRDTLSNTLEFSLGKELSLKIKELSSFLGIRKFIILQALLKSYLAQYFNTTDVVLGTPVAGRNHSQLQDQIGCYINVLALRSQILNEKTFTEIIEQVNIETEEALKNDSYPYDVLVNKLILDRQSARNPLFDVLISYDESIDSENTNTLEFIELKDENIFDNHNKYDITYAFQAESSGEITIAIKYLTSLFYDSTITAMKDQMIIWFELVLSNPNESLKNNAQSIIKEVDLVDDFI